MLMKLVAKKKKREREREREREAKSADVFFWQHDRVLWIFFPPQCRSAFTVQHKRTRKGKKDVNFYAS